MTADEATFVEDELVKMLDAESKERVAHTNAAIKAAASRPALF